MDVLTCTYWLTNHMIISEICEFFPLLTTFPNIFYHFSFFLLFLSYPMASQMLRGAWRIEISLCFCFFGLFSWKITVFSALFSTFCLAHFHLLIFFDTMNIFFFLFTHLFFYIYYLVFSHLNPNDICIYFMIFSFLSFFKIFLFYVWGKIHANLHVYFYFSFIFAFISSLSSYFHLFYLVQPFITTFYSLYLYFYYMWYYFDIFHHCTGENLIRLRVTCLVNS